MQSPSEIVLSAIKAFKSDDGNLVASFLHPEIEWTNMDGHPVPGTFKGIDQVFEKAFNRFIMLWSDIDGTVDQVLEIGNEVFVRGTYKATSVQTGKYVEASYLSVYLVKEAKIIKYQQYIDTYKLQEAISLD